RQGVLLNKKLDDLASEDPAGAAKSEFAYSVQRGGKLEVIAFSDVIAPTLNSFKDLGLKGDGLGASRSVVQVKGIDYLATILSDDEATKWLAARGGHKASSKILVLRKIDIGPWLAEAHKAAAEASVYVLTREGKLVYTSAVDVTPANFMARP